MPDIAFISEDETTVGVTIKTTTKNSSDYIRLFYEKNLFENFSKTLPKPEKYSF